MKRRKKGEGSYGTKNIKNVPYLYYRFPNKHYVYGRTKEELERKISKYKEQYIYNPNTKDIYFIDYCKKWIQIKKNDLEKSTYDNYIITINKRLQESKLGNTLITNIHVKDIQNYINELSLIYSRESIKKTWLIIKQILEYGILQGEIANIPLGIIKIPNEKNIKTKKRDIVFITPEDMERLYNEYKNNDYSIKGDVLIFLMYTGCRISEVLPATWDQISRNFNTIYINKASAKIIKRNKYGKPILNEDGSYAHEIIVKEPKTPSSKRTIPLPDRAIEILKKLYDIEPHQKGDLIFPNPNNKIYSRDDFDKIFNKMQKNSNCSQKYTIHSLRHGYASYLISKGVDIKIVSELLGHKNIEDTYNVYVGVYPKDKVNAVKNTFN